MRERTVINEAGAPADCITNNILDVWRSEGHSEGQIFFFYFCPESYEPDYKNICLHSTVSPWTVWNMYVYNTAYWINKSTVHLIQFWMNECQRCKAIATLPTFPNSLPRLFVCVEYPCSQSEGEEPCRAPFHCSQESWKKALEEEHGEKLRCKCLTFYL